MRLSVYLPGGSGCTYQAYKVLAREAEHLGFEGVFHEDNVTGHSPVPADRELLDPWSLMSALAEATETIRLGPLATPPLRRHAPLLAKTASSVDRISNGRLTIGLGSGDDEYQYLSLGQEFPRQPERVQHLRESIEVMRLLWSGERVSYAGERLTLDDAFQRPTPIQTPPKIWIAGNTSRRLLPHLAAEEADGYCLMWGDDETVARGISTYHERLAELGVDPAARETIRFIYIVFSDGPRDMDRLSKLTGVSTDYSDYGGDAVVPEDSDPAGFVWGSPDEIAARLQMRTAAMGVDHVVLAFATLGFEIDTGDLEGMAGNALGSMRLFAEQVMPTVTQWDPGQPAAAG